VKKKCSTAQIALSWVLSRGEDIVAIPGTKHVSKLEDLLGAVNVHLTREEQNRIQSSFSEVSGTRYSAGGMKNVQQREDKTK